MPISDRNPAGMNEWQMHLMRQWQTSVPYPTHQDVEQDVYSQMQFAQNGPWASLQVHTPGSVSSYASSPFEYNVYQPKGPAPTSAGIQTPVAGYDNPSTIQTPSLAYESLRQDSMTPLSCPSGDNAYFDDVMSCYSETPSSYLSPVPDFAPNPSYVDWTDPSYLNLQTYPPAPSHSQKHNSNKFPSPNTSMPGPASAPSPPASLARSNTVSEPATEVDALMLTLTPDTPPSIVPSTSWPSFSPPSTSSPNHHNSNNSKPKKHLCPEPHCFKSFSQVTHLKIHHRCHTGEKPYMCSIPSCGQRFSQLGNLRTHERRHAGQKPHRSRPNRSASSSSSSAAATRYECRLDGCAGKPFTQLGNLKSHQNKFHKETLARLCERFAASAASATLGGQGGDEEGMAYLGQEERELRRYFAELYKNSNKGIKGRGKGRKVEVVVGEGVFR